MKTIRKGLAAVLALLILAPPAAAQQGLNVSARGRKPAFSFTKDLTPPAPIPRLDLSAIATPQQQIPDPTGLIGASQVAEDEGAPPWLYGGLFLAGAGGALLIYREELGIADDKDFTYLGWGMVGIGVTALACGVLWDHGPQPWVGRTRGGMAGGVRIPIGRR